MGSEVTRACVGDPSGGWDLTGPRRKGLGRTAERDEGGCVGVPSVGGILMDVMPRASGAAVKVFGPVVVAAGDQRLGEVGCVRGEMNVETKKLAMVCVEGERAVLQAKGRTLEV